MKLIPLLLLLLAVTACSGLREFPKDKMWEFDAAGNICAEYRIVDKERMLLEHIRDVPRAECPSIFGFKVEDISPVMDWTRDAMTYAREHCE